MTLVTRCPDCYTVFRLTEAQLYLHNGDVRCGQCKQLFNGYSALITVPEYCIQPVTTLSNRFLDQPTSTDDAILPADTLLPTPVDHFDTQSPVAENSWLWLSFNIVLLVVLFGQITHAYRTELFISFPTFQPILNEYCNLMQCEIGMPRYLHLLSLESSDLRSDIPFDPNVMEFSAIIRNHAPFPQTLPALLLTLTDANEEPLASRIFTAEDYLDFTVDRLALMGRSEIQAQCFLDTNQLHAVGYKLELFYP
jgi:predicted Zn finger-like uncharacterized protein